MKSLFKIVAVFTFTTLFLVACKKDRICECSVSGVTIEATFNDASKRQAKDACIGQLVDNGDGTSTKVECKLK